MCRFSSYRKLRKFSFILVVLKPRHIFELIQRRYPLSASMVNVSMLLALLLGVAKDGPIEANSEWQCLYNLSFSAREWVGCRSLRVLSVTTPPAGQTHRFRFACEASGTPSCLLMLLDERNTLHIVDLTSEVIMQVKHVNKVPSKFLRKSKWVSVS